MASWVPIGPADTIAEGKNACTTCGDKQIVVTKVQGAFYAFDNLCSHAEGYLADGWLEGFEVECPLHGARFDVRSGAAKCLPATAPIATYPVKCEEGVLYVDVGA